MSIDSGKPVGDLVEDLRIVDELSRQYAFDAPSGLSFDGGPSLHPLQVAGKLGRSLILGRRAGTPDGDDNASDEGRVG